MSIGIASNGCVNVKLRVLIAELHSSQCLVCRSSDRSSGQELPQDRQHFGFAPQQPYLRSINADSTQAMKQALERFSTDKDREHTHPQGQLAASCKPTPACPSFSEQIRASFIRPGDVLCHPINAAST